MSTEDSAAFELSSYISLKSFSSPKHFLQNETYRPVYFAIFSAILGAILFF
jgi:hypothetical protein